MLGIVRILLLSILFFAVWKVVRYIFRLTEANRHRQSGGRFDQGPADPTREVKNASFKNEDVQDAKFRDIK